MNINFKVKFTMASVVITSLVIISCNQLGLGKDKKDNTSTLAIAVLALSSSTTSVVCNGTSVTTGTSVVSSTATLDSTTTCVTGVTSCMDTALPSWIKDNFKCAVGYVSGTSYIFKSQNVPNTKSSYYGTSSPLYEARTLTGTNPNSISVQKLSYTIPSSPTKGTGTVSTQGGGFESIGITVNGLSIYNNAAKAPDTLAVEAQTMDNFGGHPQMSGMYHHHTLPLKISSATTPDANLIGIILDGYALYGRKCDNGTATTVDDFTPADLDTLHGHTTKTVHFTTATYHYHDTSDPTATINTLMGSFFYGSTTNSKATN